MQEHHLFEYAIIRIMPRVERGEFLNVGVILYCPKQKFLQPLFTLDEKKLSALCPDLDIEEVRNHLETFTKVCKGGVNAGAIGKLEIAARFRWLTATRSTVVQSSQVHTGFSPDPQAALMRLHAQLVL
jgi:hypothetical protein